MLLTEIALFKQTPEKLITKIEKMLKSWREHLHLSYTRQMHRDKNEAYQASVSSFKKLKQDFAAGKDVLDELKALKKEIGPAVRNI